MQSSINSSIGLDDKVLMDKINYAAVSGPSFTPGIGGTYKQAPPSFNMPSEEPAQFDIIEPSPGCENTLSAGNDTVGFCETKKVTCDLGRPYQPSRRAEPHRAPTLQLQEDKQVKAVMKIKLKDAPENEDYLLRIILIVFLLYVIIGRTKLF